MDNIQQGIKSRETDILVIGAGPAGLTAGLYAARAGKKTIILEGRAASRLSIGYELENYPGFITIDSRELQKRFKDHAQHFGAEILVGDVIDFNLAFNPKMVTTRDLFIQAKAVILATGKPMSKGKMISGEEQFIGLGVSYCSTCDGPLYRDRKVLAVGNSDEAVEDVLALAEMNCDVVWASGDGKEFSVSDEILEELKKRNVTLFSKTVVRGISGDKRIEKVQLEREGIQEELKVEAVFIFRDVPTAPLFTKAGLDLDHRQCIKTGRSQSTNIEGVFAAGDLTCGGMQVVSAAGEGCVAALQAIKYLRMIRQ